MEQSEQTKKPEPGACGCGSLEVGVKPTDRADAEKGGPGKRKPAPSPCTCGCCGPVSQSA